MPSNCSVIRTPPEDHTTFTLGERSKNFDFRIPALPFVRVVLKAKRPPDPAYPKTLVTLGDHIRKRRLDLGMLQKEVATALGVRVSTVTGWEKNRHQPQLAVLPKIFAFLDYTPKPYNMEPVGLRERMRLYRHTRGISQKKLAAILGVDATTVAGWERGVVLQEQV